MESTIDFIGLVYFQSAGANRVVLIPDGRKPDNQQIPAHIGAIDIVSTDFIRADNWPEGGDSSEESGIFSRRFPIRERATLTISRLDGDGVNTKAHDGKLPPLGPLGLRVVPSRATTIARLTIANGTLRAFRMPDVDDQPGAVVSQLKVSGTGPLKIQTKSLSGKTIRTLTVADGAEVVISNASGELDASNRDPADGHFQIFGKLDPSSPLIEEPPTTKAKLPEFLSSHPYFAPPENNPSEPCSNTCC